MNKGLSLWFASSSIIILAVAAITITHSLWMALFLSVLGVCNIGWGFALKAKLRRASLENAN